ncbi:hypothetical protein EX30DRAFT_333191 [Ascodesmis nigricans]|uniref:DUF3074 domain-containing protein n=1 Tax=Ascodesmis nigricans TaxID=341454 RepID=A0A4S2MT29_9PEZI|nr:hypothetical protein EX30DRAFT_333191 [Ascodesmis nigricans]
MDLSLTPISADDITPISVPTLIHQATTLLSTLPTHPSSQTASTSSVSSLAHSVSWTPGKSAPPKIALYTTKYLGEPWIGRVVRTSEMSYEDAKEGLWTEKAETERKTVYGERDTIEVEGGWRKVEYAQGEGEVWVEDVRKLLHIQAFSAREFLETVLCYEFPPHPPSATYSTSSASHLPAPSTITPSPRSFLVISKPKSGALRDPKDVRGVYTCVERTFEMEDGGVEMFFAVTSDAGGSIPRWVQNMAMPKQVWADTEAFLGYFEGRDKGAKGEKVDEEEEEEEDYEMV